MEGSPSHVVDAALLHARIDELEQELRLRMEDVVRLDRELRHARADVTVKDEYIAALNREADKLQRIRDLLGRVPFGASVARAFEGHRLVGPEPRPALGQRAKATCSAAARRCRSRAGQLKRRVLGSGHPGY